MEDFLTATKERLEAGAVQYGPTAFLGNDMFQFIYEELFDLHNYAMFTYIKLRMIERMLHEGGIDTSVFDAVLGGEHGLSSGASAFTPARDVSGLLPEREGPQDS